MNAKTRIVLMLLPLPLALMTAGGASAQVTSSTGEYIQPQIMETTFPFEVGGKTLPAGRYDIEQPTRDLLIFRPVKGPAVEAPVMTRLAKPFTPLLEPKIIFDKVNDTYYISEVWLPDQDGFLLGGIKEAHTHQAVKSAKKK
jgi:hypothetical protein